MSATVGQFRIGELARRVGATPRTVRYYEQLGLLPDRGRPAGRHRMYDAQDEVELRELLRTRQLLGLSLADLRTWSQAERARAGLRDRWFEPDTTDRDRAEIAAAALTHLDTQIQLAASRRRELEQLEDELVARRRRVREVLTELEQEPA
jgi:MerR family transcriptional regulator, repressor of the yfmOP operon